MRRKSHSSILRTPNEHTTTMAKTWSAARNAGGVTPDYAIRSHDSQTTLSGTRLGIVHSRVCGALSPLLREGSCPIAARLNKRQPPWDAACHSAYRAGTAPRGDLFTPPNSWQKLALFQAGLSGIEVTNPAAIVVGTIWPLGRCSEFVGHFSERCRVALAAFHAPPFRASHSPAIRPGEWPRVPGASLCRCT